MKLSTIFERLVLQQAERVAPPAQVGRPRQLTDADALAQIFRVLRTGMQWREIDSSHHFTTVFRRMQLWSTRGVFRTAYANALRTYRRLYPPSRYCVDSSYVKNRYGRRGLGRNHTDRGRKALKLSVLVDQHGMAYGACCHPGNRPDVTLLDDTIQSALVDLDALPLFADRGYDSKRNRSICHEHKLADRIFRRRTKTVRRTNAKRIVVEHSFAWLDQFRRLLLCYEHDAAAYISFVTIALGHLLCRRLPK